MTGNTVNWIFLKMNWFHNFLYLVVIICHVTAQNVVTQETHGSDSDSKTSSETNPINGRRQFITAHKVATKSFTTRVIGNSGSGGVQRWITRSETGDNVLQPQVQTIVHNQQPCRLQTNVVGNTGGRSSVLNKKSIVESSQTINGPVNSLLTNGEQYLPGQKEAGEDILVIEQLGDRPINLEGSSSQAIINNVKDATRTIVTSNNDGINSVQPGIEIIENEDHVFYPDNVSQKVSILPSGDGIYANDLAGQQTQNVNVMIKPEPTLDNIVAVPVIRPHLGQFVVHGYRPNLHYYLRQADANSILNNPSVISNIPSFVQHIKPNELNVNLSDDQLRLYKQYLTQTGLIKLKPFQIIFSDQFRPNLKTLQWMVIPLETNEEYCRQRCGYLFAEKSLYRTLKDNSKIPLKLLVPILKIRRESNKSVTRTQVVTKTGKMHVPETWRSEKDS